nr:hypothetical protein CFP56_00993 [Quercus suber]
MGLAVMMKRPPARAYSSSVQGFAVRVGPEYAPEALYGTTGAGSVTIARMPICKLHAIRPKDEGFKAGPGEAQSPWSVSTRGEQMHDTRKRYTTVPPCYLVRALTGMWQRGESAAVPTTASQQRKSLASLHLADSGPERSTWRSCTRLACRATDQSRAFPPLLLVSEGGTAHHANTLNQFISHSQLAGSSKFDQDFQHSIAFSRLRGPVARKPRASLLTSRFATSLQ